MKHIILMLLLMISLIITEINAADQKWEFDVFLDDKPIGTHTFNLKNSDHKKIIDIDANFDVKLWLFSAYTYQHKNKEQWQAGCLSHLDSRTNDNGDALWVKLDQKATQAQVTTSKATKKINTNCIKSFAYWDASILKAERLLNAQTGEYMPITVKNLGAEQISVQNKKLQSTRYKITTSKFSIDLWYADNDHWIGLESTTEDNNTLKYILR